MGAFLDKPKIEKQNEDGKGNEIEYAVSSMQGWRVDMEDSHTAKLSLPELPNWSFFAVFDGHAGSKVAEYSSQHLVDEILKHDHFQKLTGGSAEENVELISQAIKDAFFVLDDKMRQSTDVKNGFDRSGSTSVCVLISPTRYYFINCGDSRALLCRKGEVLFATADHKPSNPLERDRIQKAGGSVMLQRVNGSLAVSRALGDYEYKNVQDRGPTEQLVSPEPDITAFERNYKEDQFIVLACDGIFDVSSDDDLCKYILSRLGITEHLTTVCNDVVDMSLNKGSRDNMTFVLLALPSIPKPTEEAKAAEIQLEAQLKSMIEDVCNEEKNRGGIVDLALVLETLNNKSDKNKWPFPPGGGVYAKRPFIESVYKEICPEGSTFNGDSNDVDLNRLSEQTNNVPMESGSGV